MRPVTLDIPVLMPSGILMRFVRSWDPVTNQWRNRIGRICECGQMIPYFVQIQPLDTDWDNDSN